MAEQLKPTSLFSFILVTGNEGFIRSRVAWGLRWLADRLDGLDSYGLAVESEPELDPEEVADAMIEGFDVAYRRLSAVVQQEGVERQFREAHPALFREDDLWR